MVIGATPTPDRLILQTASNLYRKQRLRRVYYSAYSPTLHADARLPSGPPPLIREHRLYQADWLLRFYGFDVHEMATDAQGNLPLDIDPKLAWALVHREQFPVDVNVAPKELLLRVPGIGVRNVERILRIRKHHRITSADLQRLRIVWRSAAPFVVTADSNPGLQWLDRLDLRRRVRPQHSPSLFDDLPPEDRP
jgi:predicted DNA-binding helix-hairpin-helix protein